MAVPRAVARHVKFRDAEGVKLDFQGGLLGLVFQNRDHSDLFNAHIYPDGSYRVLGEGDASWFNFDYAHTPAASKVR
jgi:hypothetical protein